MVKTKSELLDLLRAHKSEIKSFGVRRLGLFGSFVYDLINDSSDLDLLVEFYEGEKNYTNFSNLAIFLEDTTGRPLELMTRESLSPYLGPKILKEVEFVEINP